MKKIYQILSFFVLLVIIINCFSISVFAETASASISVSSSNIKVGDNFIITPGFSAGSVGSVQATLSYDASVIQFVSGENANGSAGVITLSGYANKSSSTMKFPLSFKAIKAGVSGITLTGAEIYSWEEQNLGNPSAGINLTVKDVTGTLSSNANLKSLTLSKGILSPAFSKLKTSYTVTVPYETDKIIISAVAEDAGAKVTVNNLNSLAVGLNTQIIRVVAADGTEKKYTVKITRQSNSSESSSTTSSTSSLPGGSEPLEEYPIEIHGKNYKFVSDFTEIKAPGDCFIPDKLTIGDAEVPVFRHSNADITLVYLLDGEKIGAFFIYHAPDSYTDFVSIKSGENLYVITKAPTEVPFQNYVKASVTIGSNQADAWNKLIDNESSDFYLLYAVNPSGQSGWYQYDIKEKTLQRTTEQAFDAISGSLQKEINSLKNYRLILIIVIAALIAVIIILIILLLLKVHKQKDSTPRYIRKQ